MEPNKCTYENIYLIVSYGFLKFDKPRKIKV
jgi:hypothetical protein